MKKQKQKPACPFQCQTRGGAWASVLNERRIGLTKPWKFFFQQSLVENSPPEFERIQREKFDSIYKGNRIENLKKLTPFRKPCQNRTNNKKAKKNKINNSMFHHICL